MCYFYSLIVYFLSNMPCCFLCPSLFFCISSGTFRFRIFYFLKSGIHFIPPFMLTFQQARNISMLFLILTVLILNYFLSCYRMYTRSCLKIAFRHLHDPAIRQMPDSNVWIPMTDRSNYDWNPSDTSKPDPDCLPPMY